MLYFVRTGEPCSDPGAVPFSTKNGTTYEFEDTVTYMCNTGYHHTGGDLNRECLASDTWSGTAPVCTSE